MGAGDAMARTVIGRFEMRMRAAKWYRTRYRYKNLTEYAAKETILDHYFKEKDGKFIISDEAAQLAGNEATLTQLYLIA